jgi:hypothetical protein
MLKRRTVIGQFADAVVKCQVSGRDRRTFVAAFDVRLAQLLVLGHAQMHCIYYRLLTLLLDVSRQLHQHRSR